MRYRKLGWDAGGLDLLTLALVAGSLLVGSLILSQYAPHWDGYLVSATLLQVAAAAGVWALFRRRISRIRSEGRLWTALPAEVSEQRYIDVTEVASEWIWETDTDHRFRYFSGGPAQDRDTVSPEVVGRTGLELGMSAEDSDALRSVISDLDQRRAFRNFVCYFERAGQRLYWRAGGKPVYDRQGKFRGYRGTATNITAEMRAKAKAERAREQLLDAIESIPEGFALYDAEDRLVLCNSNAKNIMALPEQLVPGTTFAEYARRCGESGLIKEAEGRLEEWLQDRIDRHQRAEGVSEQQLNDGRWLCVSERRTRDGGMVLIYADITERKRRESKLAEQTALLATTFENMVHGISMVDANLNLVGYNRQFVDVLDLPLGFFDKPVVNFEDLFRFNAERGEYGPGDTEAMVQQRLELARRFEPHLFERSRPNGTVIEVRGNPLPGGGFVTIYTDITARKRAEEALRQSEDRYRQLVELSPDAIFVHRNGKLSFANSAAAKMIGVATPRELFGTSILELVHPEHHRAMRERAAQLLQNGGRVPLLEMKCLRRDGTMLLIEAESTVFRQDDQLAILTVARDIGERVKAQVELRAAKEQAEFANRAKTEFLANMSHELRTPLNAVIGFSEIIANELFGPLGTRRYIEYAEDIHASGRHLLSLINDILDLSKAEAGKLELREVTVDCNRAIEGCVRLLRERAEQNGVRLRQNVGRLPPLKVDERMLKQILLNLLSNAVKFTPSGGLVDITSEIDASGALLLRIADTGIGIAEHDIPRALEAFTQVDSALSRKYDGTGLGLPLTKTLVELHGGSVDIQSIVGSGTTVTVRLPPERVLA